MKPTIIWEKWIDPFGQDHEETKWSSYDDEEEFDDESDTRDRSIPKPNRQIRAIASPMGIIPYNEYSAPSKIFNFWVAHTNFNVSETIVDLTENIDGVEILDVFTRYRFRIGIGKCFNDSDVMKNINDQLYSFVNKEYGTNS